MANKQKRLDLRCLDQLVREGYVTKRKHPEIELYVYNYTAKTQYEKRWSKYTLMCRGLILDNKGKIVARPFEKFFNLGELGPSSVPKKKPFRAFEKMDGSLGILYFWENKPYLATRGSFVSNQAIKGTRILQIKYREWFKDNELSEEHTYLFEIIYPENKIVVGYGDMEDVVMLTIIHNETGQDVPYNEHMFPWPSVKQHILPADYKIQDLAKLAEDNKEGFVALFDNGFRVKIKFSEYIRLHKILTGINERRIWEHIKSGALPKELLDRVPDEFYKWVTGVVEDLNRRYNEIETEANKVAKFLRKDEHKGIYIPRKEQAEYIFQDHSHLSGIIFNMIDDKDYIKLIWKRLKPKPTPPFKVTEQEKTQ